MTTSNIGEPPALGEATVQELRDSLRGELVLPGDDAYDEARSVWNGMIDRRPSLIVRCTGTSDVIAGVGFARSEGLTVAVRFDSPLADTMLKYVTAPSVSLVQALVFVILVIIAIAVLTVILLSTVSETVYDKQNQLQGLNGQIIATKTQIRQLLDQEHALQAQIAAMDAQLAAVQAQIDQETAKLVLLGQQVVQAKEQLSQKQAELAQQIADFGRRMRIMYKSGQVSGLELVFSAANFTDLMNRVFFFNDIVREDRRQVAELQKERAAIETMKADLEAKQAEQTQVVKQIQDQKAQLLAVRDQRAARVQQIAAIEEAPTFAELPLRV